jgi:hypothetical protein
MPILFFGLRYLVSIFTEEATGLESWFRGELGIVENLTILLLLAALVKTLLLIHRFGKLMHLAPRLFLAFYCLGCIYFAGEEASWGQHWFGWDSGEFFQATNDQGETNIHNTSVLFDRLPKAILSLLIFIGGVVVPVYFWCKSLTIDYSKKFWWLWPTRICLPSAIFATIATWPSKIENYTGWHFYFDEAQEIKELYIAGFILLFIVSLGRRISRLQLSGEKFSPL